MLVLALERATDGHDSPDCRMALENHPNTNLETGHSIQKVSFVPQKKKKKAFLLTVTLLVHHPVFIQ